MSYFPSLNSSKPGASTSPLEWSFIDPHVVGLPPEIRYLIETANREKGPLVPYIHVVQPRADYNRGFSTVFSWLNELELSEKYLIGISDGATNDAVRKSTEVAKKQIGNRPFPLRIIRGHGFETHIELGIEGPHAFYTEADVDDFDGTTAFFSCHTAPLAKKMAQISKRRFLAPIGVSDWQTSLHYSSQDRRWHLVAPRGRTVCAFEGDLENSLPPSDSLVTRVEHLRNEDLKFFADFGDVEAQHLFGLRYINQSIPRLYQLGLDYLKRAADQNFAEAQCSLGMTYLLNPDSRFQSSGRDYLRRAIKQGNTRALQAYQDLVPIPPPPMLTQPKARGAKRTFQHVNKVEISPNKRGKPETEAEALPCKAVEGEEGAETSRQPLRKRGAEYTEGS